MNIKICTKCKEKRLINEFYKNPQSKDGLHQWCKLCFRSVNKKWKASNREIKLATGRMYYKNNKERFKIKSSRRRRQPLGIYTIIKRGALGRGIEFNLDRDEFINWYGLQPQICHYCYVPSEKLSYLSYIPIKMRSRLTIDRKDNIKGYVLDNMVLCCNACNVVKNNILFYQDMLEVGQKFIRPKWEQILRMLPEKIEEQYG